MLRMAVQELDGAVAVRYPRGGENGYGADHSHEPDTCLRTGTDITLVSYGVLIGEVLAAAELLAGYGIQAEVWKLNQVCPLVSGPVVASVKKTGRLLVAEEVIAQNSVGEGLAAALAQAGVQAKIYQKNAGDGLITHGSVRQLWELLGLDRIHLTNTVREVLNYE